MSKNNRLYNCSIPIIGITGNIASGKSTVSEIIRKNKFNVICADQLVKNIYQLKETFNFIEKIAPNSIENHRIDFLKLRTIFFNNQNIKNKIEQFIYLKLEGEFKKYIKMDDTICFYDIPLLFEKNLQQHFDQIILVTVSKETQIKRLENRDGINQDLIDKMINSQMPFDKKVPMSDYIINNDGNLTNLEDQTKQTLTKIRSNFKV